MKKTGIIITLIMAFLFLFVTTPKAGQNDIPKDQLPKDVLNVLNQYMNILTTSTDIDDCAKKVAKISAGHMLSQSGSGEIARDVKEFSLKKDFQNAKFYKVPVVITRVVMTENDYDGFKSTLFEGTRYKIWIAKKDGVNGLPAPIPIIKPVQGDPKIVTVIGSL